MQVTIEISDEQINRIMTDKDFCPTKEEFREIIKQAIIKYTMESDVIENLFTERSAYNSYDRKPTPFLREIVSKIDINEDVKEVREAIVKSITENMDKLLIEFLMRGVADGISRTQYESGWFTDMVMRTMRDCNIHP